MKTFKNHHFKSNPAEFYQQPFGCSTQISLKMSQCKALCIVARHKSWKLNLQKETSYSTEDQLQKLFGIWTEKQPNMNFYQNKMVNSILKGRGVRGWPGVCFTSVKSFTKVVLNHCKLASCPSFWKDVDDILRLQKVTTEMVHMLYNLPCGKTLKEIKRFGLSEEGWKNKRWRWLNYSFISTGHWSGFPSTTERIERINSHKIKKTDKFIFSTKLCFYSDTNYQGKWWILHNLIYPKHGLEICLEDTLSSNINHWAQEINLYDLMGFFQPLDPMYL